MSRPINHVRPGWTVVIVATAFLGLIGPAWAQTQSAAPMATPPAKAVAPGALPARDDSDDPIDDRGVLEMAVSTLGGVWGWISYSFGSMFSSVTPPTPASMVRDLQEEHLKSTFFQMIGDAGYKIKEIENGIGLPPTITIKFGRIRNLSDADIDYIDRALDRWAKSDHGMIADAQRAAISTLVAINQSDSYVVDSVTMRVLPLPQFKFSLAPTRGGLGWESSQLMRAIQRLDRRVAEVQRKE